ATRAARAVGSANTPRSASPACHDVAPEETIDQRQTAAVQYPGSEGIPTRGAGRAVSPNDCAIRNRQSTNRDADSGVNFKNAHGVTSAQRHLMSVAVEN